MASKTMITIGTQTEPIITNVKLVPRPRTKVAQIKASAPKRPKEEKTFEQKPHRENAVNKTSIKYSNEHKGSYLSNYVKDTTGKTHNNEYNTIEKAKEKIEDFYNSGIKCGGIVLQKNFSKKNDPVYTIRKGCNLKIATGWREPICWVVSYE